jgi:hypothetical protein
VDRICSSCRQIDPVDGSPSAQEKSSAVFFFCFVTSLSLFWVRKSLPPFLYSKRHVFRCSAYAARHRDRLTLTTAAACQVPRRRRTRSQGKKKPTCIPPSRDPISSSAGRDAATRPRPAPESRHRRRGRPGQISTSQERENGLVRLFFCPSHPCYQNFPAVSSIKGKKRREKKRREDNRCTTRPRSTRLRLVGIGRGNKLVGAARASAILSTLASFLHPCALRRKGTEKIWVKKRKRKENASKTIQKMKRKESRAPAAHGHYGPYWTAGLGAWRHCQPSGSSPVRSSAAAAVAPRLPFLCETARAFADSRHLLFSICLFL